MCMLYDATTRCEQFKVNLKQSLLDLQCIIHGPKFRADQKPGPLMRKGGLFSGNIIRIRIIDIQFIGHAMQPHLNSVMQRML
mmetsp:Transcript_15921/g.25975  ORF Transcript_15921/g.25975 Transcript_15921/m.25975 type:complete len:82 (-) Transcript_15921:789-1034(-)